MITRKTAVKFNIIGGIDSLPNTLKSLILANGEYVEHSISYPDNPNYVLWVKKDKLDVLCSNSEFWHCLVTNKIISFDNFKVRIKSDVTDTPNDGLSNNNLFAMFYYDDSRYIDEMTTYLSDSDYQAEFALTSEFIDTIPDIKQWIRDRGIENEFDLRRTDAILKDGVKNYYGLMGEII